MSFPDRRTANVVLTILLFAAVLTVAYLARAVIVIFSFGILFAYLIDPVVQFIQRHSLLFKGLRGPHRREDLSRPTYSGRASGPRPCARLSCPQSKRAPDYPH